MPKKFSGENTKAVAARARREAVKKEEAERKKKAEEDAYWQDDDKNVTRKQRKEEAERKRMETLQRKHENRAAHDEEMKTLSRKTVGSSKRRFRILIGMVLHNIFVVEGHESGRFQITQATIEANKRAEEERKREGERERLLKEQRIEANEGEIEENVNQLEVEGKTARSVVEAINILSLGKPAIDRHPEKRVKAAYQEFEDKMLPRLREEYPTYRLSQLKQVLKKQWQKSPENPLNQRILEIIQLQYVEGYKICENLEYFISMVKVWLVESGVVCMPRSFGLEKYVKEILDDFVSDPLKRSKCCMFFLREVFLINDINFISSETTLTTHLVFLGEVLAEDIRLSDVKNMKDKYTLHVMIRSTLDPMPKLQLDSKKLLECREKFQFLRASKRTREKGNPFTIDILIIDEMNRNDFMEGLLKEFPLLKKDRMALIVAKDFILSGAMIMGKQNMEEAFLHDHPILVEVIHYWLRGVSVPPRMSHSGSSASISDNPTPASGQSGYAPIVTPEMLQEAVAQAIRNVGGNRTSQGFSSSSTSSSRNSHYFPGTLSASSSTQFTSQMAQLADFGFTNTEENRRILEETGGNVQQALELLIALRESVMDLEDVSDS
ncbi:unnamed protein product [Brugia pahangi]|uniref:UBA domain-containing protein n=1 Tax=Brugia pahangi TaxID=6280 RepID=A0A0N4SXY3_BRUPA|nr:unnamed protein product [Brugia pahangi]